MNDEHNSLEGFFRRKLNSFDESNDSWDKPDSGVWENARQQIIYPKSGFSSTPWKLILLLLLLLTACYIWFLHQRIEDLKTTQERTAQHEIQANRESSVLQKKYAADKAGLLQDNKNLRNEINTIFIEKATLERIVQQQEKFISKQKNNFLNFKNITAATPALFFIENEKTNNGSVPSENFKHESLQTLSDFRPIPTPKKQDATKPFEISKYTTPALIKPFKKERKKFEIGYEFVLLDLKIPVKRNFQNLKTSSDDLSNNEVISRAHGLSVAFSPKQNWFIRTGFRTALVELQQDFKSGLVYDKSGEYLKPNGKVATDLGLSTWTPFHQAQSDIVVDIPQGTDLKTGDLLLLKLSDYQRLRFFQIPLGLDYFHGNRRLQLLLQGGGQWNRGVFDDYVLNATISAKNKDLPIENVVLLSKSIPSKQFLSAYAGLGLNYQIAQGWHLRATLNYNYDFMDNRLSAFSKYRLINQAYKLGLNYRF